MVNSPREVVGAVLKYMGASYNTTDLDSQVTGGKVAVETNLASLMKQVSQKLLILLSKMEKVWLIFASRFAHRLDCLTVPTT